MPSIFVTDLSGHEQQIEANPDFSVMSAILDDGIMDLRAICGGLLSCATCHVYVDPSWFGALPEMSEEEGDLLSGLDLRREYSRLCCQIPATDAIDGLRVVIAPPE